MAKRKRPRRVVFVCNILAALPRKGSDSNCSEVRHPRRLNKRSTIINLTNGVIAQLGERLNGIQEVRSSILLSSTNSKKAVKMTAFSFYVSDCAIFLTAVGSWGIFFLFFGAVAQLRWLSEKTPEGCYRLQHLGCLTEKGKRERPQRG